MTSDISNFSTNQLLPKLRHENEPISLLLPPFNHETCYISRLLPSSSQKRVCFDKDNGKASFKPDAVPENHFHLGSHNYAVVSDFADVARIHLHRYKLDATGSLLPTKDGITVTPSAYGEPS
ncbi:PC4 domain-containing protein [Trichonephila clavipes]|nr:PC4 domain-containing protein [Trichonephila clavipes]